MCLWCEVEGRVYRSYEEQERNALDHIEKILQDCPAELEGEDCSDRPRCLWEKKLEFVLARLKKERLATELAGPNRCGGGEGHRPSRLSPHIPAPSISPHLLLAFERYVERMFERLTQDSEPQSPAEDPSRRLYSFSSSGDTL